MTSEQRLPFLEGDYVEVVASKLDFAASVGLHAFDGSSGHVIKKSTAKGKVIYQVEILALHANARSGKVWFPDTALKHTQRSEANEETEQSSDT